MSWDKELTYLRGFATGRGFYEFKGAINATQDMCEGKFRKDKITPVIAHPARVASYLIALGIEDEVILTTAMLHDTIEDSPNPNETEMLLRDKYHISEKVIQNVRFLDKKNSFCNNTANYYKAMEEYIAVILAKLADRCHNVSTMAGIFTPKKIAEYIKETRDYVIPLCRVAKRRYPEYGNQIFVMRYHIESLIDAIDIVYREGSEQ